MSNDKHTPLPWGLMKGPFGNQTRVYSAEKNWNVAETEWGSSFKNEISEAEANAAFIVRACNSHKALVEALEELLRAVQLREPTIEKFQAEAKATVQAQAALKQAKENA